MNEAKRNVPQLRFPEFDGEWEEGKFESFFTFPISTNSLSRSMLNYECGEVKSVHYGDILIKYSSILNVKKDSIPYITDGKLGKYESNLLNNGDIIFADAAEDDTVGKAVEVSNITDEKIVSGLHTIVARTNKKKGKYFLGYYVNSQRFHKQLIRLMQGSKVSSISKSNIKVIDLSIPKTIEEQQKIGAFFSQLDDLITRHQQKLSDVKELKAGLLQKMFPKKGEEEPEIRFPEYSGKWEEKKLGDLGKTYTGLNGKTKEDFGHGEARFVTYMNVFSNPIANSTQIANIEIDSSQNQVKYGDVMFTTSSETPTEVGMSSVWLEQTENVYLNSFCFGYRPKSYIDNYYLATMLRSPKVREKFIFLAQGISRYNISKNKAMDILVPIPEDKEQQKIGSFFSQLDDLIALHQRKLDHLHEQKKALLQQMFV